MAITSPSNGGGNRVFYKVGACGCMYEACDASKAIMDSHYAELKEGYRNALSRQILQEFDSVKPPVRHGTTVSGILSSVRVKETEDKRGVKTQYLHVGLYDDKSRESQSISVPLLSSAGLAFVHRLANAEFGKQTALTFFGEEEVGADKKVYSVYKTGLKQDGETVKPEWVLSIDKVKELRAEYLADGDTSAEAKKKLLKAEWKASKEQIEKLTQRSEDYYQARVAGNGKETSQEFMPEEASTPSKGAPDFDDDIPF